MLFLIERLIKFSQIELILEGGGGYITKGVGLKNNFSGETGYDQNNDSSN